MSHGGSFDRLDVNQKFMWDGNVQCMRTFQYRSDPGGLRNPQTSAQLFGSIQIPTVVQGPAALAKCSPRRLPRWY